MPAVGEDAGKNAGKKKTPQSGVFFIVS